ncbi:MAG: LptF/LptG family permease [Bacteroidaceae bacterium]|nr:LptF/LptG family permease [Bacteroidaceae bacterium]
MRPKRLDIFILKSFLLLFVAAFAICLFVLLMNVLWRYAEDIVGKGLKFWFLARFFWEFALTLVPQALPLAVLMASLITFGNFGERLELLAMKTAGIPLLRIMRPVMIFSIILAGVSFYFQNVTVPKAAKNLYSLIYSINEKSPELEIPEGVFYTQIKGFNMYVKHKDFDTGMLYDVTIYDHSEGYDKLRIEVADSAALETTADKQHLYLHLFSGEEFSQGNEMDLNSKGKPYTREGFREKHILLEFNSDMKQAPDGLVSSQAMSKNMNEIKHTIDSLSESQDSIGRGNMSEYKISALNTYRMQKADSVAYDNMASRYINGDSVFAVSSRSKQVDIKNYMRSKIQTQASDMAIKSTNMFYGDRTIRKHWIEWMKKITNSLSILIFFFIGAPLGAIIRKGGLGVPVLVSVFTFILFYITSVSGDKMYKQGEWSIVGCWLSVMVLSPLSVFFTIKANGDSTLFQFDVIMEFFRYWFGTKVSRNIVRKDVVIEDADRVKCSEELDNILRMSRELPESNLLSRLPNYANLFFGTVDAQELNSLNVELESLVTELGNSRDRVELGMLNGFPILQVHGVQPPFAKQWANRMVGILFPLGLLFYLRAWLFARKLNRQMVKTSQTAENLIEYIANNNK